MIKRRVKYRMCCNRICGLGGCVTEEQGGCYCVCRLIDRIDSLECAIKGTLIQRGRTWIPDPVKRKIFLSKMTNEEKEQEEKFRTIEAPMLLKKCKSLLKEKYLISPSKRRND